MKKLIAIISLILCFCMLSSALLPLSAKTPQKKALASELDFSDPARYECEELSPTEILSQILPEGSIGESEASYLSLATDSFLLINKSFSNDRISLHYNGEDTISVSASKYEYTAKNGQTVIWTPTRAYRGDAASAMTLGEDDKYFGEISTTFTDTAIVSVEYTASISISQKSLDYLLNLAYTDASAAKAELLVYEAALADYTQKKQAYEQYLKDLDKYESDLAAYEDYLLRKAAYDEDLAEYNEYLSKLPKYESELAAYEKYCAELEKYNADKAEYDRIYEESKGAMNAYLEYYNKINEINAKMRAMEMIYEKPTGYGSLFKALQNKELVAMFEEYKDELSKLGVDEAEIERLSRESDELNDLLVLYSEEREKPQPAALNFYIEHYDEICSKFNNLYDSMEKIMSPKILVKIGALIEKIKYKDDPEMAEYKKKRILVVLSQIYLVCKCLDDEKTVGTTWSFYDFEGTPKTYAFTDLLPQNIIISDSNDSSPEGLVWPDEVPPVVLPPMPQPPAEVKKPQSITVVEKPELPTELKKPQPVTAVSPPDAAPIKPEHLSVYEDIIAALDSGEIKHREASADGATLTFKNTVDKLVAFDNPPIITVYGTNLNAPLSQYIGEYDAILTPPDITLKKDSTERYVYTFEGWSLSPDTYIPIEDYKVTKDTSIYAYFSRADRLYTVTWVTPSGNTTAAFKYGETPTFSGSLDKEPTEYTVYSFERWSPSIKKVTEDATYTATYSESERKYTIVWNYLDKTKTELCSFGQMPTPPTVAQSYIEGTTLFYFAGWDSAPTMTKADAVYTALYEQKILSEADEGAAVALTQSATGFELSTEGNSVSAGELLSLAAKDGKKLTVKFGDSSVLLDKNAVSALAKGGAHRISLVTNASARSVDTSNEITDLKLLITDEDGNEVRLSKGEIKLSLPSSRQEIGNYTLYSIRQSGAKERITYTLSDGKISFTVKPNTDYRFVQLYEVTILAAENGETLLEKTIYEAGDEVTPTYYPAVSYAVSAVSFIRADDKKTYALDEWDSFVMPSSDVTLVVSYAKLRYTVKFVANGEEISSEMYEIGSMPKAPKIVEEFTDGEYRYVFAGWAPEICAVTEDVTYVAKYNSYLGPKTTIDTGDAWEAFTKQTIIPFVAIGTASVAALLALLVFISSNKKKKKKKKKKANKTQ